MKGRQNMLNMLHHKSSMNKYAIIKEDENKKRVAKTFVQSCQENFYKGKKQIDGSVSQKQQQKIYSENPHATCKHNSLNLWGTQLQIKSTTEKLQKLNDAEKMIISQNKKLHEKICHLQDIKYKMKECEREIHSLNQERQIKSKIKKSIQNEYERIQKNKLMVESDKDQIQKLIYQTIQFQMNKDFEKNIQFIDKELNDKIFDDINETPEIRYSKRLERLKFQKNQIFNDINQKAKDQYSEQSKKLKQNQSIQLMCKRTIIQKNINRKRCQIQQNYEKYLPQKLMWKEDIFKQELLKKQKAVKELKEEIMKNKMYLKKIQKSTDMEADQKELTIYKITQDITQSEQSYKMEFTELKQRKKEFLSLQSKNKDAMMEDLTKQQEQAFKQAQLNIQQKYQRQFQTISRKFSQTTANLIKERKYFQSKLGIFQEELKKFELAKYLLQIEDPQMENKQLKENRRNLIKQFCQKISRLKKCSEQLDPHKSIFYNANDYELINKQFQEKDGSVRLAAQNYNKLKKQYQKKKIQIKQFKLKYQANNDLLKQYQNNKQSLLKYIQSLYVRLQAEEKIPSFHLQKNEELQKKDFLKKKNQQS